jgi:YfiR/HmsC-like
MTLRLFMMVLLAMSLMPTARGQQIQEYQVKAAFLYNFAKFVEWPSQAFKTPMDPIVVCVLGHSPIGNVLEEMIRGKSIEGRALAFRQVGDALEASACQILFVSSSEGNRFRALAGELKPAGILTVGDTQGFAAEGGVINFKLDGGHVRFEINIDAAEHEQLRISSKLLGLAQIVKTKGPR